MRNTLGFLLVSLAISLIMFALYFMSYKIPPSHSTDVPLLKAETATEGHYTYVIVTGIDQQAYRGTQELTIEEIQELVGVKVDGKAGWETCKRIMEYNRLDQIK